ncbi:MAG: hypothetical protein AB7O32_19275, partial [Vicinamibacterales bacterium]
MDLLTPQPDRRPDSSPIKRLLLVPLSLVATVALPLVLMSSQPRAAGQAPESSRVAPVLTGLGDLHMPVSTAHSGAQAFFDQGVRLLYAFNHAEARRAFIQAARVDDRLAMAYWGQAMTLAVNLNAPMS